MFADPCSIGCPHITQLSLVAAFSICLLLTILAYDEGTHITLPYLAYKGKVYTVLPKKKEKEKKLTCTKCCSKVAKYIKAKVNNCT